MTEENNQQRKLNIKIPSDLESGTFSNAASVHVTKDGIVVDFAYALPKMNKDAETTLKVVSRVNMTHGSARSFLNLLSNAVLDFENKKKEQ